MPVQRVSRCALLVQAPAQLVSQCAQRDQVPVFVSRHAKLRFPVPLHGSSLARGQVKNRNRGKAERRSVAFGSSRAHRGQVPSALDLLLYQPVS